MIRTFGNSMMAALTLVLALPAHAGGGDAGSMDGQAFDADGYRAERYRAPVDRDPRPAARLALAAALLLHPGRDALFIDVLPADGGVRDAATGRWRLGSEHLTIPGAVWHPEAGRGTPDAALWRALVSDVRRARRRDPHVPVILFCRADCWMGWNAARRLAKAGYRNVWWLAEGIDGWRAERPLVPAVPVTVSPR